MSRTDNETEDWRREVSSSVRTGAAMIRRMAVTLTSGAFWRVVGHKLIDGKPETRDAEVFSGIGFYSRPKAGHQVDALVVFPGGAANPIIIATRDEDARKAVAAGIAQDETIAFNSSTIVLVKANGTVEIRTAGGTATKLPTLADHNNLRDAFNAHVHLSAAPSNPTGIPVAGPTPLIPVVTPSGTTVLKAQ